MVKMVYLMKYVQIKIIYPSIKEVTLIKVNFSVIFLLLRKIIKMKLKNIKGRKIKIKRIMKSSSKIMKIKIKIIKKKKLSKLNITLKKIKKKANLIFIFSITIRNALFKTQIQIQLIIHL